MAGGRSNSRDPSKDRSRTPCPCSGWALEAGVAPTSWEGGEEEEGVARWEEVLCGACRTGGSEGHKAPEPTRLAGRRCGACTAGPWHCINGSHQPVRGEAGEEERAPFGGVGEQRAQRSESAEVRGQTA